MINAITSLLISEPLRWILWVCVLVLNFLSYHQNLIRFSGEKSMFGISNYWYMYVSSIGTFSLDLLTLLGLWLTIPFTYHLPKYWFISIAIIGFGILTHIHNTSKIIKKEDEIFNSPPAYILPRKYRIYIYILILILDVIIFLQFYISSGINDYTKTRIIDILFFERFGSITKNKVNFIMSWLGIIGLFFDWLVIKLQLNYNACEYNQPNTLNF